MTLEECSLRSNMRGLRLPPLWFAPVKSLDTQESICILQWQQLLHLLLELPKREAASNP